MIEPEKKCPRCGCGLESGWPHAVCAEHPDEKDAHFRYCRGFADYVCDECETDLTKEDA